jgi:hypothetical protein
VQIELIAPVSTESASLPRMGLGILAALTPPEDEVVYTDEIVRRLDLERDLKDVDLVGSASTAGPRAGATTSPTPTGDAASRSCSAGSIRPRASTRRARTRTPSS